MTEDETEPTYVDIQATCQTDGCVNQGIPIALTIPEGGAVACGPCGNPIEYAATKDGEP